MCFFHWTSDDDPALTVLKEYTLAQELRNRERERERSDRDTDTDTDDTDTDRESIVKGRTVLPARRSTLHK